MIRKVSSQKEDTRKFDHACSKADLSYKYAGYAKPLEDILIHKGDELKVTTMI